MIKKYVLTAILSGLLGIAALAWAATDHKDFATMKLKDCEECHQAQDAPHSHGEFWIKDHRVAAAKQPSNCSSCHDQSYCLDCHKGGGIDRDLHVSNSGVDYMPKTHRSDFRELHPLKAKEAPRSCNRCHDSRKFCSECHSKFEPDELRLQSHRRQFRDIPLTAIGPTHGAFTAADCKNCHVSGVLPKREWAAEHAREARKNLSSCQSCHAEGDVCMKCHSATTGLKINPHPRNWSKISNRLRSASGNRTCVKCHL